MLLVPEEGGDLRPGVDPVDRDASVDVPEVDGPVGGAAARGQQVGLPWAPRQRLDGGGVAGERGAVLAAGFVPDVDDVVVGARGQVLAVWGPLQAADLLGVAFEGLDVVLTDPDVVVHDLASPGASRQDVLVPVHGSNPAFTRVDGSDLLLLGHVPDLHFGRACADGQERAVVDPRDRGDVVAVGRVELERELGDAAGAGIPQVDCLLQGDGHNVLARPLDQVQVKVWPHFWGVEDSVWGVWDVTEGLLGLPLSDRVLLVLGEQGRHVGLVAELCGWGGLV